LRPNFTVCLWLTSAGAAVMIPRCTYDDLDCDMQRHIAPVSLVVNNAEAPVQWDTIVKHKKIKGGCR
jgi:hypothetical protein